jgi:hypothetical protein
MAEFASWLHQQSNTDLDVAALQAFAAANAAQWPYWSDSRADYKAAIDAVNPQNRDALVMALGQLFERWKLDQGCNSETWSDIFARFALLGFGFIVAVLLYVGMYTTDFYSSLASLDQVRGLISFLITIAAVATIILIGVGIFWLEDKDEVKERFAAAKDLLTIVIGVLGTIVGFYFGTQVTERQASIQNAAISEPANGQAKVTATLAGGSAPYHYSITFVDPSNTIPADKLKAMSITDKRSENGAISEDIKIPPVAKETKLTYTLTAKDAKGQRTQANPGTLVLLPSTPAGNKPDKPAADANKPEKPTSPEPEKQP